MHETSALVNTLKSALKTKGITYSQLAQGLGMSLANVKRMFAKQSMSLVRLEEICQFAQMELSDLFLLYDANKHRQTTLTIEQEKELVADPLLLLVAICVRNRQTYDEILAHHHIEELPLIRCLSKLDRLKIIDLLPENKMRLKIADNFHWLPRGPIELFFERIIQQEFLAGSFSQDQRQFVFGLLSEKSKSVLEQKLKSLNQEFQSLARQDQGVPFEHKDSVAMFTATRDWTFSALAPYLKQS